MATFHLFHYIPHQRMHGLNGYKEIIDTFAWGLEQLGHTVQYAVNQYSNEFTNIVFGCQLLPLEVQAAMPVGSIVYNLEQLRNVLPQDVKAELQFAAKRFRIWDYSQENMATWQSVGCAAPVHVPIGFAPILVRIPKPEIQDIDVLIYGMPGAKRYQIFEQLCNHGLTCVFVSGLYGQARDDLIARSKLVLNINLWTFAQIFEIARVSYLLANQKAVVCLDEPTLAVDAHWRETLTFAPMERIVQVCMDVVDDDARRERLEAQGFAFFSKMPFLPSLEAALAKPY